MTAAERERKLAEMDVVERMLTQMELRMEQGYRQMLAEYGGQASIAALRSVIEGLRPRSRGARACSTSPKASPSRSQLKPKFEEVIGEANRANVTFYPVDADGLASAQRGSPSCLATSTVAGSQGLGDSQREHGAMDEGARAPGAAAVLTPWPRHSAAWRKKPAGS